MKHFIHYFLPLGVILILSLVFTGCIQHLYAEQDRAASAYEAAENRNSEDSPDDGTVSESLTGYQNSNPAASSSASASESEVGITEYTAPSAVMQESKKSAGSPSPKPTGFIAATSTNSAAAQPGKPVPSATAGISAALPAKVSIDKLIGQTENQVVSVFGLPDSSVLSEYGFTWSVYHRDYKKFIMIGIDMGKVVGVYSNSSFFTLSDCTVGTSRSAVRAFLSSGYGSPLSGIMKGTAYYKISNPEQKDVFFDGAKYVTVFYDNLESGALTSVQIITKNTELLISYFGSPSAGLASAYAKTSFFLANAIRARKGLPALIWDDNLASIAKAHSTDMGTGLFFSHTGSDGSTVPDRLSAAGIRYVNYAENIAKNHPSAIAAHESLMNSSAHRDSILGSSKRLGVGVFMDRQAVLITQDFIS